MKRHTKFSRRVWAIALCLMMMLPSLGLEVLAAESEPPFNDPLIISSGPITVASLFDVAAEAEDGGSFTVRVVYEDGTPMPGAGFNIVLMDNGSSLMFTKTPGVTEYVCSAEGEVEHCQTDLGGVLSFQNLPDGDYRLYASYLLGVSRIVKAQTITVADGEITFPYGINNSESYGYAAWDAEENILTVTNIFAPQARAIYGVKTWVDGGIEHNNPEELTIKAERRLA
ncbi:MAG: carboxypeptidase-like regulatory domain-containing protein, partial [Firmicutes bacterium]|nr:carboxypeptidase-like regulatory domain-containing protein [Bacillota bacterium]